MENNINQINQRELFAAVFNGDFARVRRLVEVLEVDISFRNTEASEYIREGGVLLNNGYIYNETPAHVAAQEGHIEILRYLEEAGADLEAGDCDNETPAHWAAEAGNIEILEHLEEAGANLEAQDNRGRTPCHRAAGSGHIETVIHLAEVVRVGVYRKDNRGRTSAHLAAMNGHDKVLDYITGLIGYTEIRDSRGRTPADIVAGRRLYQRDLSEKAFDRYAGIYFKNRAGSVCENRRRNHILVEVERSRGLYKVESLFPIERAGRPCDDGNKGPFLVEVERSRGLYKVESLFPIERAGRPCDDGNKGPSR